MIQYAMRANAQCLTNSLSLTQTARVHEYWDIRFEDQLILDRNGKLRMEDTVQFYWSQLRLTLRETMRLLPCIVLLVSVNAEQWFSCVDCIVCSELRHNLRAAETLQKSLTCSAAHRQDVSAS